MSLRIAALMFLLREPAAEIWETKAAASAKRPVVGLPDETERIELSDEGCITVAQVLNVLLR